MWYAVINLVNVFFSTAVSKEDKKKKKKKACIHLEPIRAYIHIIESGIC